MTMKYMDSQDQGFSASLNVISKTPSVREFHEVIRFSLKKIRRNVNK